MFLSWHGFRNIGGMRHTFRLRTFWNSTTTWESLGWFIVTGLILLTCFFYFFEPVYAAEQNLNTVIDQILSNNYTVQSAQQAVESAQYNVTVMGALPDPKVSVKTGAQGTIGLTQDFRNTGMINAEANAAREEAAIASINYTAMQRDVSQQVKETYYKLFAVQKSLSLLVEQKQSVQIMYHSALAQYQTGKVSQQDPLSASLMLAELTTKEYALEQDQSVLLATLKQLNGGQTISISAVTLPTFTTISSTALELQQRAANTGNLEILKATHELEKSRQNTERVNGWNLPEFEIGAEYSPAMKSTDGMFGVSLPLWLNKNEALYKAQASQLQSTKTNYAQVLADTNYAIETSLAKIVATEKMLTIYETISLPQATQAFSVARAEYQSGRVDFQRWLTAETKILETAAMYYQLQSERAMAIATLEKLTGLNLEKR